MNVPVLVLLWNIGLKMKRSTIAKDFEAKQASAGNERSAIVEQPVAPTLGGTVNNHRPDGWSGAGSMGGGPFASLEEVNELRQAVALKVRGPRRMFPSCKRRGGRSWV